MQKLISQVKEINIPIVLGDVPSLLPQYQPYADTINKELQASCASYDKCFILPLHEIVHQTLKDGYIIQGGKKYLVQELIPDGLHIVKPASLYLADRIAKLFD